MTRTQQAVMKAAMRRVFAAGEDWGVTYSTWFDPTPETTERRAKVAINKAMASIARHLRSQRKR